MSKAYRKGLFIFRRDLRLEDNRGLLALLEAAEVVLPVFIFDPRQAEPDENPYFSAPAFAFLLASLAELDQALQARGSRLYIGTGTPADVVQQLIHDDAVDAVFVNKDYTPFSRQRDRAIADVADDAGVPFVRHDDVALSILEPIRTNQDTLYTVFTPFMKKAMQQAVAAPRKNNFANYFSAALTTPTSSLAAIAKRHDKPNPHQILRGGRSEALELLAENTYLKHYQTKRNFPATAGTSRLSAHHKFGTISIRETYHMVKEQAGEHSQFIAELYWRDFYYYIAYHFPIVFRHSFLPWAKHIKWQNNQNEFAAWCNGTTGVPMVDAAMRELNTTGWMHNRSRMIVASYLTKNLLINWQWGEQYFAQKLIDYDPAQNNGGWQWSASTGADPRPLRIFNPYTQASKYDAEAQYIQTWVPELKDVPAETLIDGKTHNFSSLAPDYPAPLVDQKETYHRAMAVYKEAKEIYKQHQSNEKE